MGRKKQNKKSEKPVKLFTLDTETRGLFGSVFRLGLYDGDTYTAGYTFEDIKPVFLKYTTKYDCHVYIHNLDFDLAKLAGDLVEHADLDKSIFINNNVAVFTTSVNEAMHQEEPDLISQPIVFHDSYKILTGSLAKLCQDFGLPENDMKKDLTDHIKSLGWAKVDEDGTYNKFESEGYYFQNVDPDEPELNSYLEYDCRSLYTLIEKTIEISGLPIDDFLACPTAASLAMRVYKTHYTKDYKQAVSSNYRGTFGSFAEDFMRAGYYGGRVEVFQPEMEKAFHYDVNSLYPYVMKKYEYPVGWYDFYRDQEAKQMLGYWLSMHEGAGLAEIDIHVPDMHIPPLPYRGKGKYKGKLLFPTGNLTGVWTFPEIEMAMEVGCTIKEVHQVFYWKKTAPIFKEYIEYWEQIKITSKGARRAFAKLCSNALYGKFGMQRKRRTLMPASVIPDLEEQDIPYVTCFHPLMEGEFVDTYTFSQADYIQPHIAAYVTSLARMVLYKGLIDERTGEKAYCDTDSIVSQLEFPSDQVDDKEYGKWKLENDVVRGIYLQPKLYFEETSEGENVKKAKGIPKEKLRKWGKGTYENILQEIKDGEEYIQFYEGYETRKKFVTQLKNGETFDLAANLKKGMNLRAKQKRKMDYENNSSSPHRIMDFYLEGETPEPDELQDYYMMELAALENEYTPEIDTCIDRFGYIQIPVKGDTFFHEYADLPEETRRKYFRKDGLALDVWCEESCLSENELFECL